MQRMREELPSISTQVPQQSGQDPIVQENQPIQEEEQEEEQEQEQGRTDSRPTPNRIKLRERKARRAKKKEPLIQ